MAQLLCFIGTDGSGKTAHIKEIMKASSRLGLRCQIVRCGAAIRFVTFPFFLTGLLLGLTQYTEKKERKVHTSRFPLVHKNKPLSTLWPYLVFIDMFILVFIRIKSRLMFQDIIFCDRSLQDVLVEIMVSTRNNDFYKTRLANLMLSLIKPSIVIMLDVDPRDALRRKNDIPDIEFLTIRKNLYRKIAVQQNICVINASRSFIEVHKEIEQAIKPVLLSSLKHDDKT